MVPIADTTAHILESVSKPLSAYGVATMSTLHKIIRLFCKRALWKRRYSAKETYNFKEPTNRSHPIWGLRWVPGNNMVLLINPMRILVRLVLNWKVLSNLKICCTLSAISCISVSVSVAIAVAAAVMTVTATVIATKSQSLCRYRCLYVAITVFMSLSQSLCRYRSCSHYVAIAVVMSLSLSQSPRSQSLWHHGECDCDSAIMTVTATAKQISRLLKITVLSLAEEPYREDNILQKSPIIWRSVLIVATP